jgi:dTDP-glucose 4,6-dehydratase
MNVLVLDQGTFVGKEITKKFLKLGHNICIMDDGNMMPIEKANYITADRNDSVQVISKLEDAIFDVVIDLSAEFVEHTKTVVNCLKNSVRHFIQISSAAVYKESSCQPVVEVSPRGFNPNWWNSSRHKYLIEEFLLKFHNENNFPVTILRPFYIYGSENDNYQENYIFQRLIQRIPIMVPSKGQTIIQFGHTAS